MHIINKRRIQVMNDRGGGVCSRMKRFVVVRHSRYDDDGGGGGAPQRFPFNTRLVVCSAICEGSSRGCSGSAQGPESCSGVVGLMLMVG